MAVLLLRKDEEVDDDEQQQILYLVKIPVHMEQLNVL